MMNDFYIVFSHSNTFDKVVMLFYLLFQLCKPVIHQPVCDQYPAK